MPRLRKPQVLGGLAPGNQPHRSVESPRSIYRQKVRIVKNLLTPPRVAVLLILLMVGIIAAWSKLRYVEAEDHKPQRWRLEEYRGLDHKPVGLTGHSEAAPKATN